MTSQENQWKIIGRYDSYITSTNQKAAVTIAYNAFIVAGIILKNSDILGLYTGCPRASHLAAFLLIIATAVSLVSIWLTFYMILPYLWSPKKSNSVIFYGDVADHKDAVAYIEQLNSTGDKSFQNDLAVQTYAVAKGAIKKFKWMRTGLLLILFIQLPALALLLVTKLCILL